MKKTIAMLLVLALTLASVSVSAFAATSATADGTVNFTKGKVPEIVPDPDPNVKYEVRGLDFGTHSMDENLVEQTYASLIAARSIAGKTTGVNIENTYTDGWNVTVTRTEFTVGTVTPVTVMDGAELTLIPVPVGTVLDAANPGTSTVTQNPKPGTGAIGAPTPSTQLVTIGADANVFVATAGQGLGIWGALWSGTLKVPANKAAVGDAKSTLTWTVTPVILP